MAKVYVFFATGFEETEAVIPVDLLRRAEIDVCLTSITGKLEVTGSHGITILTERLYDEVDFSDGDMLLLPGGQPGTTNLSNYEPLCELISEWNREKKRLAAICAAPTVFGKLGLLKGAKATCYPGCEEQLLGAITSTEVVVTDGNITTSRGVGTAIEFAAEIIRLLRDEETAEKIKGNIVF